MPPTPTPPTTPPTALPAGFTVYSSIDRTGLWVASKAKEKQGKTHLAFQMPGTLAVISCDTGTKAIADKFIRQGLKRREQILWCPFILEERSTNKGEHKTRWEALKKSFEAAWKSKAVNGCLIDTGTAMYDLCQLAKFGKMKQNNQFEYGEMYAEFEGLLLEAYDERPDWNVVISHKIKKEYLKPPKADKADWTGKYELDGYKKIGFLVDILIDHDLRVPPGRDTDNNPFLPEFVITIRDSRYNATTVLGMELVGDYCNWEMLYGVTREE